MKQIKIQDLSLLEFRLQIRSGASRPCDRPPPPQSHQTSTQTVN